MDTKFDEIVIGDKDDNNITTGDGDDLIISGKGDDIILSGGGDDIIKSGKGDDTIDAGAGDDIVNAGKGNDVVNGGDGNDRLIGGSGDDELSGGDGNNEIYGGDGNDTLYGGSGINLLVGQEGNDTIYFDSLDQIIHGEDGLADTLHSLSSTSSLVEYREFSDTDVYQNLHLTPNEDVAGVHHLNIFGDFPDFEAVRLALFADTELFIQTPLTNLNFTYSDNLFLYEINGQPEDFTLDGDMYKILVEVLYDGLQVAELFNIPVNSLETTEVDLDFFV